MRQNFFLPTQTAFITIFLLIGLSFLTSFYPKKVFAAGGGCEDASSQSITGTDNFVSFSAPSGQVVTSVCVKSSTSHTTFSSNTSNGCYSISGIGTQTVTVTRVDSGSSCQEISHVDVYYATYQPTPTGAQSKTENINPTLTSIVTPTPTSTQESTTPTPTTSATTNTENSNTQNNTNTSGSGSSNSNNSGSSSLNSSNSTQSPTPTPEPLQAVLGAARRVLPQTGLETVWIAATVILMLAGASAVGLGLYRKGDFSKWLKWLRRSEQQ